MNVLGIETSCDETAVAIVNEKKEILAHVLKSQFDVHERFGGVVPELASRSHIAFLESIVKQAIHDAKIAYSDLDAIAATTGPGLIGGVIVGTMFAKGLALAANKPFIAVNHLEGHALIPRITNDVVFPFLLLLVSGGHCQILMVENVGKYKLLGSTVDDAVGEAFDKVAKMLGLPYPGGPAVEKMARTGNAQAFNLPKPFFNEPHCNFSFSGLKTAVKRVIDENPDLRKEDLCASFQYTVGEILAKKIKLSAIQARDLKISQLVIAGGVAANAYLRARIASEVADLGLELVAPPLQLCTDNGVMIAWAGLERFRLGLINDLDFEPRSRWPLVEL